MSEYLQRRTQLLCWRGRCHTAGTWWSRCGDKRCSRRCRDAQPPSYTAPVTFLSLGAAASRSKLSCMATESSGRDQYSRLSAAARCSGLCRCEHHGAHCLRPTACPDSRQEGAANRLFQGLGSRPSIRIVAISAISHFATWPELLDDRMLRRLLRRLQ